MNRFLSIAVFFCFLLNSLVNGEKFLPSLQKPIYHITPSQGHWMNDPNGPMVYDNTWHLFAQYNPNAPVWGDMSWQHWTSSDGVFWTVRGVALQNEYPYDIGGVFSGSTLIVEDIPILFYTCVDENTIEQQCLAKPNSLNDQYLTNWTRSTSNPVITTTELPTDSNPIQFRDPALWIENGNNKNNKIIMITAVEIDNIGCIVEYESEYTTNPIHWKFRSILWNSSNPSSSYNTYMVECPDFYQIMSTNNDLHILKFSVMESRRELYEIGHYNFDEGEFLRDTGKYPFSLDYDHGPNNNFYASKSFLVDADDISSTRILWGWSPEQDDDDEFEQRDWAGVMALPREVTFDTSLGILRFNPYSKLQSLRKLDEHVHLNNLQLIEDTITKSTSDEVVLLSIPEITELAFEVIIEFEITKSSEDDTAWCFNEDGNNADTGTGINIGIHARASADDINYTSIGLAISKNFNLTTFINTHKSSGSTPAYLFEHIIPVNNSSALLFKEENKNVINIKTQFFFDFSIVEFYFFDGVSASTVRIYPSDEQKYFSVFASACNGASVSIKSLDYWPLNSIWK